VKKKEKRRKEAYRASRLQAPLPAVRAGQKIKSVFYIGEEKETNKNKYKGIKKTNVMSIMKMQKI